MLKHVILPLLFAVVISSPSLLAQDQGSHKQDEKPNSTEDKHSIIVQTDSGRYGVGAEKLDPKQFGVAIYPGAKVDAREDNRSDASLLLDWGQDSTRLYVQKYITSDSPDKVVSFYRKQLSKSGPVLECRNGKPLDTVPTGIGCDTSDDRMGVELKVGSEKKQHIVGVSTVPQGTEFGLVYLEETVRSKR